MPTVDILDQPTVVEATNDVAVVAFTEANVTVEVPSPAPVVEFASSTSGLIVAGTGLTGGGALIGNVSLALSAASIASLAKAETAVQPGVGVSTFPNDAGYLTAATVEGGFQPLSDDLTYIANLTTTVFGRSFLELADAAAARTLLGVYGTADVYTKAEVSALVTGFAAASHTHDNTDIVSVAWSKLTGIPTLFPPGAHTHLMADITDLNFTADHGGLTGLADDDHLQYHTDARGDARYSLLGHTHAYAATVHTHLWADITDKPLTFAPSSHTHLWADITDKPTTFTPAAHVHAAGDVTSGVFSTALLGTGTANSGTFLRGDGTWAGIPGGVTDHGALTGLADDDHTQYHTDARGDARYLQLTGGSLTGSLYATQFNVANGSLWSQGTELKLEASGSNTLAFAVGGAVRATIDGSGSFSTIGSIQSAGTGATLWFNDRSGVNSNWAWYSDNGVESYLYASGGYGNVLTINRSGILQVAHVMPGKIAWNTETFTFDGDTLPHYGITWYSDSRNLGGNSLAIAGYGGITFIAQGAEHARLDAVKLQVTGHVVATGDLVANTSIYAYGGYVYGPSDKLVMQLTDSYLRLNQSGSFTSGIYTPGAFRADGGINAGLDGTRWQVAADGTSVQRYYTDATPVAYHEWYIDTGSAARPIYLRFHQGNRWYNRLKVESDKLSFVGGADDNLGLAEFRQQILRAAGSHLTMYESDGLDPADRGILEVNGGYVNLYTHDNSANVWHLPLQADITTGQTFIGSNAYNGYSVRIRSSNGYGEFGPANTSWFHMSTDRPSFYMANPLHVNGAIVRYATNYYIDSDGYYFGASSERLRAIQGTYGTASFFGSKNGWAGLRFDSGHQAPYVMFSTSGTQCGFYDETSGWRVYYNGTSIELGAGSFLVPYADWGTGYARMSRGTAAPGGGNNGDIYFQYT